MMDSFYFGARYNDAVARSAVASAQDYKGVTLFDGVNNHDGTAAAIIDQTAAKATITSNDTITNILQPTSFWNRLRYIHFS